MNAYDALPYPGFPYPQSHPDRMRTVGRLLGLEPAPAERCRVLELGCGDGGNLVPMAWALPGSEFLGIDLGAEHIRLGQERARELSLRNLTLRHQDIMDFGPGEGEFDYIIAYGLYSWVPEEAGERILEIAGRHLADRGIAYVNYTANPGGRMRQTVREMMLYAAGGADGSEERIRRARALLETLQNAPALDAAHSGWIKEEARRILGRDPVFVCHDELADVYRSFWFHEFMERAAAHGLQYAAEAGLSDSHIGAAVDGADILHREQYLDFMKGRAFRQTLLCRSGLELEHGLKTEVMPQLFAALNATAAEADGGATEFRGPHGAVTTAHPLATAVLSKLAAAWPEPVPIADLNRAVGEEHAASVAQVLLNTFAAGLLSLYSSPPKTAAAAGEKPLAPAFARLQATRGNKVSTLLHTYITVTDAPARRLITLLDGTRDRKALLRDLGAGGTAAELEDSLRALCRFGLLVR